MKTDFTSDFADFLEERLGKALHNLRETNAEYRNLSDDMETMLNCRCQSVDECRQVISQIPDAGKKLSSIEKHYLFLAGMRERMKVEDALLSDTFEKFFTQIE